MKQWRINIDLGCSAQDHKLKIQFGEHDLLGKFLIELDSQKIYISELSQLVQSTDLNWLSESYRVSV